MPFKTVYTLSGYAIGTTQSIDEDELDTCIICFNLNTMEYTLRQLVEKKLVIPGITVFEEMVEFEGPRTVQVYPKEKESKI